MIKILERLYTIKLNNQQSYIDADIAEPHIPGAYLSALVVLVFTLFKIAFFLNPASLYWSETG